LVAGFDLLAGKTTNSRRAASLPAVSGIAPKLTAFSVLKPLYRLTGLNPGFSKCLPFYICNMATTAGQHPMPRDQINGILPVTASQTAGNTSKASANKSAGPRLKVVIRRLAPGLTEAEFVKLLGDDWRLGQGRVDWFSYKPGKDSKEYIFLYPTVKFGADSTTVSLSNPGLHEPTSTLLAMPIS
jgi:Smg-4/UPF3 family